MDEETNWIILGGNPGVRIKIDGRLARADIPCDSGDGSELSIFDLGDPFQFTIESNDRDVLLRIDLSPLHADRLADWIKTRLSK